MCFHLEAAKTLREAPKKLFVRRRAHQPTPTRGTKHLVYPASDTWRSCCSRYESAIFFSFSYIIKEINLGGVQLEVKVIAGEGEQKEGGKQRVRAGCDSYSCLSTVNVTAIFFPLQWFKPAN